MSENESGFRVPCEIKLRYKQIRPEELDRFQLFSLRSSGKHHLRSEIEQCLHAVDLSSSSKALVEKGFQLLLHLDQKLDRIEREFQKQFSQETEEKPYQSCQVQLGGTGLIWSTSGLKEGEQLILDMVVPNIPEQQMLLGARVKQKVDDGYELEFNAIHEEDREYIYRYVASREREILRRRALEKKKDDEST